ncbi:4826_t:CDS:1 [Cetraspora pellucida]|uniref:4826_t:CDS:1 n=1 Tax=Cetraspora pellucida TaxID=1433469 RepID=A0A9N9A2W3_9GLOM|nr:4826_t:CDS:1 [Cetraspora pellucida]
MSRFIITFILLLLLISISNSHFLSCYNHPIVPNIDSYKCGGENGHQVCGCGEKFSECLSTAQNEQSVDCNRDGHLNINTRSYPYTFNFNRHLFRRKACPYPFFMDMPFSTKAQSGGCNNQYGGWQGCSSEMYEGSCNDCEDFCVDVASPEGVGDISVYNPITSVPTIVDAVPMEMDLIELDSIDLEPIEMEPVEVEPIEIDMEEF